MCLKTLMLTGQQTLNTKLPSINQPEKKAFQDAKKKPKENVLSFPKLHNFKSFHKTNTKKFIKLFILTPSTPNTFVSLRNKTQLSIMNKQLKSQKIQAANYYTQPRGYGVIVWRF